MAFPVNGPATRAATKFQAGISADDATYDARIDAIVVAVNAKVLTWPVAAKADGVADWNVATVQDIVVGANMLGARIHRRVNSPDGTASLGTELLGVAMGDPEIALLLEVDAGAKPQVG